jgi:hypothetical protein
MLIQLGNYGMHAVYVCMHKNFSTFPQNYMQAAIGLALKGVQYSLIIHGVFFPAAV